MTDEYRAYRAMDELMQHDVIEHQARYADGPIHTNTVEGFWSLLKRAWYVTPSLQQGFHAAVCGRDVLEIQSPQGRAGV